MRKNTARIKLKSISIAAMIVVMTASVFFGYLVGQQSFAAAEGTPATAETGTDPLISLSYLNNVLKPQIIASLDEMIRAKVETELAGQISEQIKADIFTYVSAGVNEKLAELDAKIAAAEEKLNNMSGSASGYTVLHLLKGQKLYAKTAVELIHRAGTCRVITPFAEQGIADMTISNELLNGEYLSLNDYCLIPRGDDGRGIEVVSDEIYIMVRGEYEIEG
ncbi:MAG: hypothetical protein VB118_05875 [Oscillospiraceae bacterium]|nr:hypothetical protein [Oscillospiraceae bacterium]